jgi:hypothetical protein
MTSETVSVRVPPETKTWLERFSLSRGSLSSSAARLLEEAHRRETFPFVEFRDSSFGRLAYVQGSRIAVYFASLTAQDYDSDAGKLAKHFNWSLAKTESILAYATRFSSEIEKKAALHKENDDFNHLRNLFPNLEQRAV